MLSSDVLRYIASPLLAAVIGGFLVHFAARRRDRENDRRRQRVDYLVAAYRVITRSAQRDLSVDNRSESLEDALADVIMFGSLEQIRQTRTVIEALAMNKAAPIDSLLLDLRVELRQQLDLPDDDLGGVPLVRMTWGDPQSGPLTLENAYNVIFEAQLERTKAALVDVGSSPHSPPSDRITELLAMADRAPGAAVVGAYQLLAEHLRASVGTTDRVDPVELAKLGVAEGKISAAAEQSIEDLKLLMELSHKGGSGTGLDPSRAAKYVDLVATLIYTFELPTADKQS